MSEVSLSDCYTKSSGPALINGTQALVRLLLEQARRDRANGLNTRGLVSGYPGSPLGGLDLELGRSKRFLDEEGIVFQPGLNEELAATALWGSQHIGIYDQSEYDGVFALWYGKGPGLDRAMDALRHANHGGVAPKGGMVIAVGDDPTGKSSTLAYQSDQGFISLGVPYFYPRRVEDIIPMGLQAFALSRYAGCVVGLKIVIDTADANVVLDTGGIQPEIKTLEPLVDVHVGRHDPSLLRETRLHQKRLPAVASWLAEHDVNQVLSNPSQKKLGIVAVGKAVMETREALHSIGIDTPEDHGIGLLSVAVPYPLEAKVLVAFAQDYQDILVIEEKRGIVEEQLARMLVNMKSPPKLSGKTTPEGELLLPSYGELSVEMIADAIINRGEAQGIKACGSAKTAAHQAHDNLPAIPTRTPFYCAGCPHNSSTKLGEGEIAGMGIGCHSISGFLTPDTITNFTQMGGEGAFWIGRAPFSPIDHTLQNMGDGTYTHSGYLGIRAAIAAGVNMTFKILYNDAVAMTGGQDAAGGSEPDAIARQVLSEGVKRVAVVTDQIEEIKAAGQWPEGVEFHHRRDLLVVQEDLSQVKGVTCLLYVQTCAAELRRRRKRGKIPDRAERLLINEAVCEGCGDCAVKSNCVAVKPVVHPEGIKRQVDQSVCNKDYSCNEGFCPSFVSIVPKGAMAEQKRPALPSAELPPPQAAKDGISNIYIAGIGGTGISTLSAMLVMAGRLDGVHAQAMNLTGLSQKNGGVTAQVRMSRDTLLNDRMVRLPPQSADLLLGCDAVVAVHDVALKTLSPERSTALLNARVDPVGVAGVGAGHVVDDRLLLTRLHAAMDKHKIHHQNVADLSERLLGNTTTANVMLLGMAVQMGLIPISITAMEGALRLNGIAVDDNLKAFSWGRWLAHDPEVVLKASGVISNKPEIDEKPASDALEYFASRLVAYHNQAYAEQYREVTAPLLAQLAKIIPHDDRLARKAARAAYRIMAIKDEYEVARLMTAPEFNDQIKSQFGGAASLHYHLAPPLMGFLKHRNGKPKKIRFGAWMTTVFKGLKALKPLRGTAFDVFGYNQERRREWAFRDQGLALITAMTPQLTSENTTHFEAILDAMLFVRGYGYVKLASLDAAEQQLETLKNTPITEGQDHHDQRLRRAE